VLVEHAGRGRLALRHLAVVHLRDQAASAAAGFSAVPAPASGVRGGRDNRRQRDAPIHWQAGARCGADRRGLAFSTSQATAPDLRPRASAHARAPRRCAGELGEVRRQLRRLGIFVP
jgi:hypothetical protein